MKNSLISLIVLPVLMLCALAHAGPVPDKPAPTEPGSYVYLGYVDDTGKITEPTFAGLPVVAPSPDGQTIAKLASPVPVVSRQGNKVHTEPKASAATVGLLWTGAHVKLVKVFVSYRYAWGEIDTRETKPIALTLWRSYDGRNGDSPGQPSVNVTAWPMCIDELREPVSIFYGSESPGIFLGSGASAPVAIHISMPPESGPPQRLNC